MNYWSNRKLIHQLSTLLITIVVLSIPFYYLYQNTDRIVVNEAGKQATGVSIAIAKFIEDDVQNYQNLVSIDDYATGNYDEVYYQKMLGIFQNIKSETDADYIYTLKMVSETEVAFILDAEVPGTENFSPLGSKDAMFDFELVSFEQGIPIATDLIDDPAWGKFITGFAPIMNSKTGEVIGLVGVDYSSEHILLILQSVRNFLILTLIALTALINILINRLVENRNKSFQIDYLTNLLSKQYLHKFLPDLIKEFKRTQQGFCLMLMDIDNFKEFNDRYGHLYGDRVLISVAQNIQLNIRNYDLCFRYGGDEFIVILPNTMPDQATVIANRIQEYLNRNPITLNEDGSEKKSITLSIGIALWDKQKSEPQIIEQADQAMYTSKNQGRNRITISINE